MVGKVTLQNNVDNFYKNKDYDTFANFEQEFIGKLKVKLKLKQLLIRFQMKTRS